MSCITPTWFQNSCRLVLFFFTLASFHPANLRVPWTLHFAHWTFDFGPTPAYSQAADLAPTPDADSTDPFIVQKAQELGNDPMRIFTFVRDEIGYESYKGSLRGARGTLWSKAGNALDQASLMIALLRASGIPARYVQGTLPHNLAQELILSMFPTPLRVVGCLNPGTEVADPANDPQLLAETREHYWVQFGTGFQDADPTFANAQIGQTFTSPAGTFTEVPDNLRHKVTIRLKRELTTPLAGLFGVPTQDVATVLEQTFITPAVVGKPLSIGHFVNSNSLGAVFTSVTNSYSPYVIVGDIDARTSEEDLIPGDAYQEVLTNFPLGSTILTGVFLEISASGPDGPTETYERAIVDRLGFNVRRNGGTPNLSIDPSGAPILTPFDIHTVSVMPGLQEPTAGVGLNTELVQLSARLSELGTEGANTPEFTSGIMRFSVGMTRLLAVNFLTASDALTGQLANTALVKAYYDRPRITILSHQIKPDLAAQTSQSVFAIDLRRDHIRARSYPGQSKKAQKSFNVAYGLSESLLEGQVMALLSPPGEPQAQIINTALIVEAAQAQRIGFSTITPDTAAQLETLSISPEAKARITDALSLGKSILVPQRNVEVDGISTVGWYETDPDTGETIWVSENGGHNASIVYADILLTVGALVVILGVIGPLVTAAFDAFNRLNQCAPEKRQECIQNLIKEVGEKKDLYLALVAFAAIVELKFWFNQGTQSNSSSDGGPQASIGRSPFSKVYGLLAQLADLSVPIATAAEPSTSPSPLGNVLSSPQSLDQFGSLAGTGVAASIVPDPLLVLPFGGALVPTVFRIGIKNTGATTDTVALSFSNMPAGFTAQTSVPQITIPPGETAEVGICLRPTSGLPAPGTQVSFALNVNGSTAATSDTEAFTVPEVHGVTWVASPPIVNTTPGVQGGTTLTLTSVGNVAEHVTFDLDLPAGLSANGGLSPVSLGIGETATQTLTLTPAANTPLNSTLTAIITANFGAPEPQTLVIPVRVAVPGADAIADAAVAAGQLGNNDLANRLNDLSLALTNLVQDPSSAVFKSQALAALDSVLSQLANDPNFSAFVNDLTAARNALAVANTPDAVQTAVTDLGGELDTFATVATGLARHNFEAFLLPNTQVAQPQTPATFELWLHNIGTDITTYNLSLDSLPAGVQGQLNQASVTLNRDDFASVTVTLTQTSTTELLAFNFAVLVAVEGAPEISRAVPGALVVRNEVVSVVAVTADPPFADPGDPINVSARLLNAVNREQQALVSYLVKDPNGQTVFTSQPVPMTLTVQTSLTTVELGTLDTTGFALGQYTIEVTVADLNSNPIPGARGEGNLLIGSPVTANISVTPETLPPGNGVVTNTLQIDTSVTFSDPFTLLGQFPGNAAGGSVVLVGSIAYVCAGNGINLFDVTDPTSPQFLKAVGFPAGICRLRGDTLVALRGGNTFVVALYSLADPQNPQFLGSTPEIPYNFAIDLAVTDTHAFVTTLQFVFFVGSNDIFAQNGDVLAIDISNPSAPQLVDVLLNTNGTNNDGITVVGGVDQSGGNFNMFATVQADAQTLLVASTTATGTDTQTGTGVVRVIDISDPTNLSEVGTLAIPGTVQLVGMARQGTQILVTASSGGWQDFFNDQNVGLSGNLVLALVDVSDPHAPQLLTTKTLTRSGHSVGMAEAVGNGKYAFSSLGAFNDTPQLFLVDASDPSNLIVSAINVPAEISRMTAVGDLLYTTSSAGLLIYDIGESIGIPVTAQVQVPKNTGVAVVPNSFTVSPTEILNGPDFDTLVWDLVLASGTTSQSFSWQSTVSNLQPGEAREVTLDSMVDFVVQGTPGQILLPPTVVASQRILSIHPPVQTVSPGQEALYFVTVKNPTNAPVTYDLSVQGIPQSWVTLASSVTVPANSATEIDLTLTAEPFAALTEYGFVVTATANGTSGSVVASLILEGQPILPGVDTVARGVVVALTPTQGTAGQGTAAHFTVRVTNTGSQTDTFNLHIAGLNGVGASFAHPSVEVPPGASNFREVGLTLTPQVGTTPGSVLFTVVAQSVAKPDVSATDQGTLTVVANGVDVALSPKSGTPATAYQLTVTNTGQVQDTFDLAMGGPVGVVATLDTTAVTLGPGQSQTIAIALGAIDFAYPGGLTLVGTATSRGHQAVRDSDTAMVTITPRMGVAADFDPNAVQLPTPGSTGSSLLVDNTGNIEDAYTATITETTGGVIASLTGLDGQATQQIPLFRLPGLATAAIALSAQKGTPGMGTVTVAVTSLTDPSIADTATITIHVAGEPPPTNQPPVADAGPERNVETNTEVTLDGSNSFDPDGDLITYEWRLLEVPAGSQVTDADIVGSTTPNPTFTPDVAGDYVLQLIVRDARGAESEPDEVTITAVPPNVPPNANAGVDQTVLLGETVVVDGSSSDDPDDGPQSLSFQWTFAAVPTGSTLTDADITAADQAVASFMPDVLGTYWLRLEVLDGQARDADEVVIEVTVPNVPPTAAAGEDQTVLAGEEVVLDGRGSQDPDDGPQPLTFTWRLVSVPEGSLLTNEDIEEADTATPHFTPDVAGSYVVELEVFDGAAVAFDNVLIKVLPAPLAVRIDIKPGSFPNSINPRAKGVIPVAIFTTAKAKGEPLDFDAATLDPLSVKFGPQGATEVHRRGHLEDVDKDGDRDMVLHFDTQATGIQCGDTAASLTGQTLSGQQITGIDAVRTTGCK